MVLNGYEVPNRERQSVRWMPWLLVTGFELKGWNMYIHALANHTNRTKP